MRILGIDPGFAITGYGVVEYENNKFKVLDYGVIKTKAGCDFEKRLLLLSEGIELLIKKYKPEQSAVEDLFFNKNVKTAIKAAQGRGAALLTCAKCNLEIFEYTPLQVKQAVTGYGRADKNQVQQMVKSMLSLNKIPKPDDAADALACAICHAHSASILRKYKKGI